MTRSLPLTIALNTYTTEVQVFPSVASGAAGNFVVVWDVFGPDGSEVGVFGQRFSAGGIRLFPAGLANKTSVLNFAAGLTRSNNAVATLGRNGEVAVRCDLPPGSTGGTHLVLDVFGYFKR